MRKFLYLLCLFSVPSFGQVALLDAWACSATDTLDFGAVSAGSNRILISAITIADNSAGGSPLEVSTATFGDQSQVQGIEQSYTAVNTDVSALFYILDAGITAATGTTIGVTHNGGTVDDIIICAASYQNVNQTGGASTIIETNMAEGATSPLSVDITAVTGSLVVAAGSTSVQTHLLSWSGVTEVAEQADSTSKLGAGALVAGSDALIEIDFTSSGSQRLTAVSMEVAEASTVAPLAAAYYQMVNQ